MFDSLDPPADLGTARARLGAVASRLAGGGPILHLRQTSGAEPGRCWPPVEPDAVVVADGVLWRAGPADLRALAGAMVADQALLFLEPSADVGWRRAVHRLARPLLRRAVGHHFDADVPALLRAAGLEVVDLNRFGIGPAQARSYVMGRAVPRVDGWP